MMFRGGILGGLLLVFTISAQAAPYVDQVNATQYGSFIRITYRLHGTFFELAAAKVEFRLSQDGGLTYPHRATTLYGDTGVTLVEGARRVVYWDAYNDLPEQSTASAVLWARVLAPGLINSTPLPEATSLPFSLDTRIAFLDGDGDLQPEDQGDLDEDGTPDVLQDFDGDGAPDAFEDHDADGYPDAYRDLNGDGIGEGLQDLDGDGFPDYRRQDRLVHSPSHPYSNAWYFTRDFHAVWPEYAPGSPGFYWAIDQSATTRLWTTDSYTTDREVAVSVPEDGQWYLHLAAADDEGVADDQAVFPFKVYTQIPAVSSISHPAPDTVNLAQDFVADLTFPGSETQWQQVKQNWPWRYDHTSLSFKNRLWILGGSNAASMNDIWWSTDGQTWGKASAQASWPARHSHASVVFNGRMWILGGSSNGSARSDIWSSRDGVNWDQVTAEAPWGPRAAHAALVFANKIWILGGNDGVSNNNDVWSSSDGVNWTEVTDAAEWAPRRYHAAAIFDGKMWVMGGYRQTDAWSSSDGESWTRGTDNAPWTAFGDRFQAFARHGLLWVLGNSHSSSWAAFSPDGTRWYSYYEYALSTRAYFTVTEFNNRLWMLGGRQLISVGGQEYVFTSYDGTGWTNVPRRPGWGGRKNPATAAFAGKMWVLGGYDDYTFHWLNDIWTSEDGIQWDQVAENAPWPPGRNPQALVYDNKLWILLNGTGEDVWWTEDGVNWHLTERWADWDEQYAALSFGDRMWVFGIRENDPYSSAAWWSTDGIRWTSVSTGLKFRLDNISAFVYDDKMWIIGGKASLGSTPQRNVAWSTDGAHWTVVTSAPPWSNRQESNAFAFGGKMWVVGGNSYPSPGTALSDIWQSTNGINWETVTDEWPWLPRTGPGIQAFKDRLWVLAGDYQNDVWCYDPQGPTARGGIYLVDEQPDTDPRGTGIVAHNLPVVVTNLAPGDYWFHIAAMDAVGHVLPPVHYPFRISEISAPLVSSPTHPDENVGYATSVTFNWDAGTLQGLTYLYAFDQNPQTEPTTETAEETLSTCAQPGTWWFHVRGVDSAGNLSPIAHRQVVVAPLDAIPVRSSTHPVERHPYPNRSLAFEWDPMPDVHQYYYAFGTGVVEFPADEGNSLGDQLSTVFEDLDLGEYTFLLRGRDDCGVLTPASRFDIVITDAALSVSLEPGSKPSNLRFLISDPYNFATGTPKYWLTLDSSPDTWPSERTVGWSDPVYPIYSAHPGLRYFHVRGVNASGVSSRTEHLAVYIGESVLQLSPPSPAVTRSGPVVYTVNYPEATQITLSSADVTLVTTGTATGAVNIEETGGANERRIVISDVAGDGQISVQVAPGTAAQGDLIVPAVEESIACTVDNTRPLVTISAPSSPYTVGETVSWEIEVADVEANANLDPWDVDLSSTGTAAGSTSITRIDASHWRVSLENASGLGTLSIGIHDAAFRDTAGNDSDPAGPADAVKVGGYSLEVFAEGTGTTAPEPGAHLLPWGEPVSLTATAGHGWAFDYWNVDGEIIMDPALSIVMDEDRQATAHFKAGAFHSADSDEDARINLSELLRVIQFQNAGGYRCAVPPESTEDGYEAGPGEETDCAAHDSDYAAADWAINLSELLRAVQIFNAGGYYSCPADGTEDGFCPGNEGGL